MKLISPSEQASLVTMAYFDEIENAKTLRKNGIRLSSVGFIAAIFIGAHIYTTISKLQSHETRPHYINYEYAGLAITACLAVSGQIMREIGKRRREHYMQRARQEVPHPLRGGPF